MLIAQISDFHLATDTLVQGRIDSRATLEDALARLAALDPAPDLVVATGDLVNKGERRDYEALKPMLDALPMPVYLLAGNHDDRDELRRLANGHAYLPAEGPLQYAIEAGPLRLVCLDTTVPGEMGGTLDGERLAWLDATLAARPDRPTLIFMHHPPFRTGIGFMDRLGLRGRERFAEVLGRHPQVRRLLCGHLHRHVEASFAGIPATAAPALPFQMDLRLAPDAPSAWVREPAGFLLHLWHDEALVSHGCILGDFGPAEPFARSRPQ